MNQLIPWDVRIAALLAILVLLAMILEFMPAVLTATSIAVFAYVAVKAFGRHAAQRSNPFDRNLD